MRNHSLVWNGKTPGQISIFSKIRNNCSLATVFATAALALMLYGCAPDRQEFIADCVKLYGPDHQCACGEFYDTTEDASTPSESFKAIHESIKKAKKPSDLPASTQWGIAMMASVCRDKR